MKAWFLQKTVQEQKILFIAGVLIGLIFLYAFTYLPITRAKQSSQSYIIRHQADLTDMQSMAQQLRAFGQKTQNPETDSTQIMSIIEKTSKQQHLSIAQIKPLSKNRVQIRLEEVLFNDCIRWLNTLQRTKGIQVEKLATQENKTLTDMQITLSY